MSDLVMPGMDGWECPPLLRDPVLAEIPVVLLTAVDERWACSPELLRPTAILAKPVVVADLLRIVLHYC